MIIEPKIEYTKTTDGQNIGFTELGDGPLLVVMPGDPLTQIQLAWQTPKWRQFYLRLATAVNLIAYDGRGAGVSTPGDTNLSINSQILDLEAVVAHRGTRRPALFAPITAGPAAIKFASEHPNEISHLILWCSYANSDDYFKTPNWKAMAILMDTNWDVFMQTLSHSRLEGAEANDSDESETLAHPIDQNSFRSAIKSAQNTDVRHLLGRIRVPTLVMHRGELHMGPGTETAQEIASEIRNSKIAILEGTSAAPYQGDSDRVVDEIAEFLGIEMPALQSTDTIELNADVLDLLTTREAEVLTLIGGGLSNHEIADLLVVSEETIKTHVKNMFSKLGVRSRTQALSRARANE